MHTIHKNGCLTEPIKQPFTKSVLRLQAADGEKAVSILPVGVGGVGLLYGEYTRGVYSLYFDTSGAVNDTFLIDKNPHVGYLVCRLVCITLWGGFVIVAEKCQIARFGRGKAAYQPSLRRLLGGVSQKRMPEKRENGLCKTRTVHTECVLAAP